jgi:hypothetical protein
MEEARRRRKIRVEKLRLLRVKALNPAATITSNEDFETENLANSRKLRNRESALKSRKRKQDELDHLRDRVHSLEEEVRMLRSRLMAYEGPRALYRFGTDCKPTLEPAVFKV